MSDSGDARRHRRKMEAGDFVLSENRRRVPFQRTAKIYSAHLEKGSDAAVARTRNGRHRQSKRLRGSSAEGRIFDDRFRRNSAPDSGNDGGLGKQAAVSLIYVGTISFRFSQERIRVKVAAFNNFWAAAVITQTNLTAFRAIAKRRRDVEKVAANK